MEYDRAKQIVEQLKKKMYVFRRRHFLNLNYSEEIQLLNPFSYRSLRHDHPPSQHFSEQVQTIPPNIQLTTPLPIAKQALSTLPLNIGVINIALSTLCLSVYGEQLFKDVLIYSELPLKKKIQGFGVIRGYTLFLYEDQKVLKQGKLIMGQLDSEISCSTLLVNKQPSIIIYKQTPVRMFYQNYNRWQEEILKILIKRNYYIYLAQFQQDPSTQFLEFIEGKSDICKIKLNSKKQTNFYLNNQIVLYEVLKNLYKHTFMISIIRKAKVFYIQNIPQVIQKNIQFNWNLFANVRKLTLKNCLNKNSFETLIKYLKENISPFLNQLDVSENVLSGSIGQFMQGISNRIYSQISAKKSIVKQHILTYYGFENVRLNQSDIVKMVQALDRVHKKLMQRGEYNYSQLAHLNISNNKLYSKSLSYLGNFLRSYYGLGILNLSNCNSDIPNQFFDGISGNLGLRKLQLKGNNIPQGQGMQTMLDNNISLFQIDIPYMHPLKQTYIDYYEINKIYTY